MTNNPKTILKKKKLTNFCFAFLIFSKKTDNYNTYYILLSEQEKCSLRTEYKNKKSFFKFKKKTFNMYQKQEKKVNQKSLSFVSSIK